MSENAIVLMPEVAADLAGNTEQLGRYLVQMAAMMKTIQNRLEQLEENERKVTLSHTEVKDVQQLIRLRSAEYCEKYNIVSPGNLRRVSNGIKRAVLTRYGVKDLHDVPAIARQAVEAQISRWSDVRLMMKCRDALAAEGGT